MFRPLCSHPPKSASNAVRNGNTFNAEYQLQIVRIDMKVANKCMRQSHVLFFDFRTEFYP